MPPILDALWHALEADHPIASWLKASKAIYFYGSNQFARNVQLQGLQDAAQEWGIPFHLVYEGQDVPFLEHRPAEDEVVLVTYGHLLSRISWLREDAHTRVLLLGRYYNESPNHGLCPLITAPEIATIKDFRARIVGVLSEFSQEGNQHYLRGYAMDLGLPVMAFPWGANVIRHRPVTGEPERDVVFVGSYFEKPERINVYFGPVLARHRHTIIGQGWGRSPFGLPESFLTAFNHAAPYLYSLHLVSLNIHHPFELAGYSCNERTFNSIACGGFQICDDARRVREFFLPDEVPQAATPEEYVDLVDHFVRHPEARRPYMERAQARVLAEHSYHHRLAEMLRFALTGRTTSPYCTVLTG